MHGLHFGEAGMAVALAEAISCGVYLSKEATVSLASFLRRALSGSTSDWPDVTHVSRRPAVSQLYTVRTGSPTRDCSICRIGAPRI